MAASLGDLVVSIAGDIAKLELSMSRAERTVAQTAEKMEAFAARANAALAGIGASLVGVAAIQKFGDSIEGAIEKAAGLQEMAKKTATSAEELSKLSQVAKQSNTDMNEVAKGVQTMARAMLDTAAGTGKARDTLSSLKLEVKDSNGQLKNGVAFLQEFAKKTADMSNETQRLGALQKVLKGTGAELSNFLYQLAEAGELNAKVTNRQAFEAEQYEKSVRSLTAAKALLYNVIAQQVTPVLTALTRTYTTLITGTDSLGSKTKELAQQNQIREWAVNAGIAVAMLIDGFRYVALGIKVVGDAVVAVGMVFIGAFDIIGKLIGTLSASMADFGQLIQGIGLVMAGQFTVGAQMIGSALGHLKAGWKGFGEDVKADMGLLGDSLLAVGDDIDHMLEAFKQSATVDLFLNQLQQVQSELEKTRKGAGTTTDIIKAFKKDGIDGLTASMAKNAALYVQQITDLQTLGRETKATTVSTTAAVLAEMEHSGALAEHTRRTGESEEATKKRVMGLAGLNDKLLEIIETEKGHVAALKAEHDATMSEVDKLTALRDQMQTYGLLADAVTRFNIARLQEKLDAVSLFDKEGKVSEELRERIDILQQLAEKQKAFQDLQNSIKAWTELGDIIGNTAKMAVTDWGGAVKYLRDQLKQLLADMIALFAKRWFLSVIADMTGNSALGAAASVAGNGTAAGSILNYAGSALSASRYGSTVMGWFGGSGLSSAQGIAGIDALEAGGTSPGITGTYAASQAGGSTALSSFLHVAGPYLAIAAGILQSYNLYGQGWTGKPGTATMGMNDLGRVTGTPIWSPAGMIAGFTDRGLHGLGFSARNAAILSGTTGIQRLFGWQDPHADASGIRGSFSGMGYTADNYQDVSQRGGTFRSDRRWTEGIAFNQGETDVFTSFMDQLKGTMTWLGNALHVDAAQVLASYTHDFQLQLTDNGKPLSDDEVHGLLSGLFGTVLQDQVALMFDAAGKSSLSAYIKGLKGTGDEITTAINEFLGVMSGAMQSGLSNFTVESVMAMERTGESLGDTFTRLMGDWAKVEDAFTPDSTKLKNASNDLSALYGDLTKFGYQVPTTREGWLDVMRSLDMSTAAGQELFERMLALAPSFDAVTSAAESMMSSFDDLMGKLRPGYTAGRQQLSLDSDVGQFMANNPWTAGQTPAQIIAALGTITREDFSHYSVANQQLILSILGLNDTLHATTDAAQGFTAALNYAQISQDGLKSGYDFSKSLGNVFQGDFKTRMPQLIASITGEIDQITARMNMPGAVSTPGWIADQSRMAALTGERYSAQRDLNRYWELEGQAPGHGEALLGLEKWFADSKTLIGNNVPGLLALEQEFQRRREEIMKSGGDAANSALESSMNQLKQWWQGLFFDSTLSPLSVQDQFTQAKAQYETTLSLAQSGDAGAVGSLSTDAQRYLTLARQIYSSGADYTAIFRTVAQQTGGVAGVSPADVNAKLGLSLPDGKLASSKDIQALASEVRDALVATASDPQMLAKLDQILDALGKLKQSGVLA